MLYRLNTINMNLMEAVSTFDQASLNFHWFIKKKTCYKSSVYQLHESTFSNLTYICNI